MMMRQVFLNFLNPMAQWGVDLLHNLMYFNRVGILF